jgi:hypothetical protein
MVANFGCPREATGQLFESVNENELRPVDSEKKQKKVVNPVPLWSGSVSLVIAMFHHHHQE